MSKSKKRKKINYKATNPVVNPDRALTEEERKDIVIPYVKERFIFGLRAMFIYLGALFLLMFVSVLLSGGEHVWLMIPYGGLFFFLLYLLMFFLQRINVRKVKNKTLFIKEVEFLRFSEVSKRKSSFKYNNIVVPVMLVREKTPDGRVRDAMYDCLLQDTDHFSAGNKINRRLQRGDKVYKITDEKGEVFLLIGEGKKHPKDAKQNIFVTAVRGIVSAFLCCFGLGIFLLVIYSVITLLYYLYECVKYRTFLQWSHITWFTFFGTATNGWEFLLFTFLLPIIVFLVILLLMPVLGDFITDILFGVSGEKKE